MKINLKNFLTSALTGAAVVVASSLAAFAVPYKKGMELAVEQVNAGGGLLGKNLEVIYRDDQGKPGEAVKIAEELMTLLACWIGYFILCCGEKSSLSRI